MCYIAAETIHAAMSTGTALACTTANTRTATTAVATAGVDADQVGTLLYIAPEIVRGDKYDEKCDVYSFAVVLLGLLQLRRHVFELFTSALHERRAAESAATAAAKSVEAAAGVAPSNGSSGGAAAAAAAAAATTTDGAATGATATTGTGAKGAPRYTPHMVTVAIVTESLRPALPPVSSSPTILTAAAISFLSFVSLYSLLAVHSLPICRCCVQKQTKVRHVAIELGATAACRHTTAHFMILQLLLY
jgi:hypothetical protein